MGFDHASVKINMEDYAIFWDVSVEVVTRGLPAKVLPAFDKLFDFLERCFSMGLEEASAESKIISCCRLDMGQISDLQVFIVLHIMSVISTATDAMTRH